MEGGESTLSYSCMAPMREGRESTFRTTGAPVYIRKCEPLFVCASTTNRPMQRTLEMQSPAPMPQLRIDQYATCVRHCILYTSSTCIPSTMNRLTGDRGGWGGVGKGVRSPFVLLPFSSTMPAPSTLNASYPPFPFVDYPQPSLNHYSAEHSPPVAGSHCFEQHTVHVISFPCYTITFPPRFSRASKSGRPPWSPAQSPSSRAAWRPPRPAAASPPRPARQCT